jgi:aminoglycoside 6-adenylyltransferase
MGKYFKKYLSAQHYEMYAKTYSDSDYQNVWSAVFTACDLFRELAQEVAEHFGYEYNEKEDTNMMKYLNVVKNRILEENAQGQRL